VATPLSRRLGLDNLILFRPSRSRYGWRSWRTFGNNGVQDVKRASDDGFREASVWIVRVRIERRE
jgi:hypothetical protein